MNREHLKAVLWLRWRLTRNQWVRSRGLSAVISALVAVAAIITAISSFLLALAAGMFGLVDAKPEVIMGAWLGVTLAFLLFWGIGLVQEIQRSETIDLQRLLHLPVALGPMFVINYLASHFALSVVITVPVMLGLALGLAFSRSGWMLLMAPLALAMVFMITAWTYCLRGWLAGLMANPRLRRTVIVAVTFVFVLAFQAPNLYFNFIQRRSLPPPGASQEELRRHMTTRRSTDRDMLNQYLTVQAFVPPLWVPGGALAMADGNVWPAVMGTMGCLGIGAVGLRRAYRSTVRAYRGDTGGKLAAPAERRHETVVASAAPRTPGRGFMERLLPGVPEQAAAVALATFRSMVRAPEVKMSMAMSFLMTLLGVGMLAFRNTWQAPQWAAPFAVTGSAAFSTFMLMQFFNNQFGFDRDGFRAFMLSPADRRLILLGKNLAGLPVGVGFGVTLVAIAAVWFKPPAAVVLAGLIQLAMLLMLAGMMGNILSILVPYRMQAGTLKPTKMPGLVVLVMFAGMFLIPVVMSPSLAGPVAEYAWQDSGRSGGEFINLLVSAVMTALIAVVYWKTLGPLGRLMQRRETKILAVVSVEVE